MIQQLDLFASIETSVRELPEFLPLVLNGFYYEQSSKKFVSYVQGRRHYEILASACRHDKAWKDAIMKERFI
jgi:hypothetical protein